jgi:hypothetical protein
MAHQGHMYCRGPATCSILLGRGPSSRLRNGSQLADDCRQRQQAAVGGAAGCFSLAAQHTVRDLAALQQSCLQRIAGRRQAHSSNYCCAAACQLWRDTDLQVCAHCILQGALSCEPAAIPPPRTISGSMGNHDVMLPSTL